METNGQPCAFERLVKRINNISEWMALSEDILKIVKTMNNEIVFHFPIKMDDGTVRLITGYRMQHNNVLGPYKGGLRFHSSVSSDSMRALALLRTLKTALLGIPLGGAMGGIPINPNEFSLEELEKISRRYIYNLGCNVGPEYDIIEPDINANSQVMAWMYDTYLSTMPPHERNRLTHIVTGKPQKLGGTFGIDKATGQGLFYLIQAWAKDNKRSLEDLTVMIQGFGNVGYWSARLLKNAGIQVIALQDKKGSIYSPKGIDPDDLLKYINQNRQLIHYPEAKSISSDQFFQTKADIFISAALDGQINIKTAPLINAKLILEGTDFTIEDESYEILKEKGIVVLPDILSNTGSLIVHYFEWLQNKRSEFWDLEMVDDKLEKKILSAYAQVKQVVNECDTDWRTAAHIAAISRLDKVYNERGVFP